MSPPGSNCCSVGRDADGAEHLVDGLHHLGVAGELAGLPDDLYLEVANAGGVEHLPGLGRVEAVGADLCRAGEVGGHHAADRHDGPLRARP